MSAVPNRNGQGCEPSGGDAARRGRASGGPSAATPPARLLEESPNVVTNAKKVELHEFHIAKAGCDCWYCPDCCERRGFNLRARLIPVLAKFKALMMVTLTIDPELFASERDAYFHVRQERGVSRLVRELLRRGHLHSERYFCVLEFQEDTKFVHYHLLLDASFVPKKAIDKAWSRLRPKSAGEVAPNRPAFGMTRFSKRQFEGGALQAARYATKYLVKVPEYGWPSWVVELGSKCRVPRYSTSRGLWGESRRKPAVPTGRTRSREGVSYASRMASCGTTCNVFETAEGVDQRTGEIEVRPRWRARIAIGFETARVLSPAYGLSKRRVGLVATSTRVCLQMLAVAAGHRVPVLASRRGDPLS